MSRCARSTGRRGVFGSEQCDINLIPCRLIAVSRPAAQPSRALTATSNVRRDLPFSTGLHMTLCVFLKATRPGAFIKRTGNAYPWKTKDQTKYDERATAFSNQCISLS